MTLITDAVGRALDDGALGIGLQPAYNPGARHDEVYRVFEVAARRGALVADPSPVCEDDMPTTQAGRTRFEHANPILRVADLARSVRYYVDVLGFANAEWGGDDFTCVTRDGASIHLSEGDQGQPGTWVWIGVEDVEALHGEYRQSGATILEPPRNFPWAREMKVGDPDGHVLRLGSDPNDDA